MWATERVARRKIEWRLPESAAAVARRSALSACSVAATVALHRLDAALDIACMQSDEPPS